MIESHKISRNRVMQVKWRWQDTEDRKKVSWQKKGIPLYVKGNESVGWLLWHD